MSSVASVRVRVAALAVAAALASAIAAADAHAADGALAPDAVTQTRSEVVTRSDPDRPAPRLTRIEQERMVRRHLKSREVVAAQAAGAPDPSPVLGADDDQATSQIATSLAPSASILVRRNIRNTVADDNELQEGYSLMLAEPAAANDANEVLFMGNTYGSRSADNGDNWVPDALPGGPSQAPIPCCDADVVHHRVLDTTFSVLLYLNSTFTRGVATIAVRSGTIGDGIDCFYDIDPGTNITPDYPHIAVAGNYLYLGTNNINSQGTTTSQDDTWAGADMIRLDATQMATCAASVSSTTFDYGPLGTTTGARTFVPVENASSTMYWGAIEDSTASSFRIFRWKSGSSSVGQFVRSLGTTSNFVNSDCRGGIGNFDWIERGTSFSNLGFRLRGAYAPDSAAVSGGRLWFMWNTGADATHPQAHIHSALFRASDLTLLSTPSIADPNTCMGFPTISANAAGFFALTVAAGGKAGGGGPAAQGYVSVDDDTTAGQSFATPFYRTAMGTHNAEDERFGDYFTIRKDDRCTRAWVATNYSLLNGNTSSAHVNARYVEFGSQSDASCF